MRFVMQLASASRMRFNRWWTALTDRPRRSASAGALVSSTYRILVYRDVPRAGPVNDKFSYYTPDDFLRVYSSTALAEQMMTGMSRSRVSS